MELILSFIAIPATAAQEQTRQLIASSSVEAPQLTQAQDSMSISVLLFNKKPTAAMRVVAQTDAA